MTTSATSTSTTTSSKHKSAPVDSKREAACTSRAGRSTVGDEQATAISRNLVLVFDGTSNTFGTDMSSMPTLYSLLSADRRAQLSYYQTGIGTGSYESPFTPAGLVQKIKMVLDLAVAWDLPTHVKEGYNFLVANYTPGDKIYLFGFSRGAFTARALAGMLQQVGLLLKGNEDSTGLAFQIYKQGADAELAPGLGLAAEFKKTFSLDVKVEFVGVWDTVSSVGAIIPRTLPFSAGSFQVMHFRQCLALDERRVRFSPQPFMGAGADPSIDKDDKEPLEASMKEVWFCGAHSDIGGGRLPTDGDKTNRLSHLPLRWMIREAMENGLALDFNAIHSSELYAPFLDEAARRLQSRDSDLLGYIGSGANFSSKASHELIAIVYVATLPSPTSHADALSPRGDSLSFMIKSSPKLSFGARLKEIWNGFTQRLLTAGWWLLEITPTLRIVWDVEGEARSRKWRWNLGHPRHLTHAPVFHHSVRARTEAESSALSAVPGDGTSVPETKYEPAARWAKGEGSDSRAWDDGRWIELHKLTEQLEQEKQRTARA